MQRDERAQLTLCADVGLGGLTLSVAGDICLSTVDTLLDAARDELSRNDGPLMLDFAGVTFFGSTGITALLALHNDRKAAGHKMRLINPPEPVRRVLRLTGLLDVLDVEPGRLEPRQGD